MEKSTAGRTVTNFDSPESSVEHPRDRADQDVRRVEALPRLAVEAEARRDDLLVGRDDDVGADERHPQVARALPSTQAGLLRHVEAARDRGVGVDDQLDERRTSASRGRCGRRVRRSRPRACPPRARRSNPCRSGSSTRSSRRRSRSPAPPSVSIFALKLSRSSSSASSSARRAASALVVATCLLELVHALAQLLVVVDGSTGRCTSVEKKLPIGCVTFETASWSGVITVSAASPIAFSGPALPSR